MKTKHLLVVTFSMGFTIIILISNTGLAFAAIMTNSTWYHFGYDAACTDAKNGIPIWWDSQGTIWDGFYDKYSKSLTDNPEWFQGYRDGAICTHTHTPQYNVGFEIGCHDKQTGAMCFDGDLYAIVPPNHDKDWILGYYDSGLHTSFCPDPNPK
jgi:hypothetical protein